MVFVPPNPEVPDAPAVGTLLFSLCCVRSAALMQWSVEEEQCSFGLPSQFVSLCAFLWWLTDIH